MDLVSVGQLSITDTQSIPLGMVVSYWTDILGRWEGPKVGCLFVLEAVHSFIITFFSSALRF